MRGELTVRGNLKCMAGVQGKPEVGTQWVEWL